MTLPQSQRKKDGGRIAGPADVANVVEYRVVTTLPNNKKQSFAFNGHFTTPPADMQVLAGAAWTAVSASWGTNMAPHMHTGTILNEVLVRNMTSHTNPVFVGSGTSVPGTGAAAAMPLENSIVLTENVAQRGRGLKGRMYIAGWDTSVDATGGNITTAAQTAVNAFGTSLFNFLQAQTQTPCVPQPARAQYIGLTGATHPQRAQGFAPVSSYTVNDLFWDTQRRRGN